MSAVFATYPSLKDKTVFITGGASGIGASLVEHFWQQGSRVAFVDINVDAGRDLVERLSDGTGREHPAPLFIECDLRNISALQSAIGLASLAFSPVTALINNAGHDDRHQSDTVSVEYWDDRMAVNLRHQFFAAQAVRAGMKAGGGGSIINLGPISWMLGQTGYPAYTTAKSAVHGLTKSLAREFGPDRIRVNVICPGWVMTERQKSLWLDKDSEKALHNSQSLPDKLMPEDIARAALFLAADDSRMCTGQEFIVDAGWV